jgi:hypothetical protein
MAETNLLIVNLIDSALHTVIEYMREFSAN